VAFSLIVKDLQRIWGWGRWCLGEGDRTNYTRWEWRRV